MNREYLLLSHPFTEKRFSGTSQFASEKLDGVRCLWDGGVSRGLPTSSVPWANTAKDSRYLNVQVATGLWSRYGKAIQAPRCFIDKLPPFPLDGELWCGRGQWQKLTSIIKQLVPDPIAWREVKYMVFDKPTMRAFLSDGRINNPNCKMTFLGFDQSELVKDLLLHESVTAFESTYNWLATCTHWDDQIQLHKQIKLPLGYTEQRKAIDAMAIEIGAMGGEGIMLRRGSSYWYPLRADYLLKVKPWKDAEAKVVGYMTGVLGVEGRRLGKLGSLILDWDGVVFNLSGFNNHEIELPPLATDWAMSHPGAELPSEFQSHIFPRGSIVTFKYRELTDEKKPKEARYWRKYENM